MCLGVGAAATGWLVAGRATAREIRRESYSNCFATTLSGTVAARIRAVLKHLPPGRLIPAPDCGMKYIPRELAFASSKH